MITGSDIAYVLSGGSSNTNPYLSLGGDPSGYTIQGSLNNLFPNIGVELATAGDEDYRCIYIFNNNETDSLWEAELYIAEQVSEGSDLAIGVQQATDIQKISFVNAPTGGSFTASYGGEEFTADYGVNNSDFATNFKSALVGTGLISSDVTVEVSTGGGVLYFTINFIGEDNYRYHELIELISNDLVGTTEIQFSKLSNGAPINSIAALLPTVRTVPNGVTFTIPSISDPIEIGTLNSGEGFPIWIRRTTPSNAAAVEDDGFTLTLKGSPIQP